MRFVPCISGTRVMDFNITPIFNKQIISLADVIAKVKRQETMNWLLDTLRFTKGNDGNWYATIDYDTNYKLSILEDYPEYERELVGYFGENWMKQYIRFNH